MRILWKNLKYKEIEARGLGLGGEDEIGEEEEETTTSATNDALVRIIMLKVNEERTRE